MRTLRAAVPALDAPGSGFAFSSSGDTLTLRVPDVFAAVVDALVAQHEIWPAGDPDAAPVYDATSVDAVTAARIRRLYGGADGEARAARRWRAADELARDPEAPAVDHIEAEGVLAEDRILRERAEHVITEARVLKQTRGWR